MKIYEEKPVTKVERTLTKIICDVCENEISENNYYYKITTEHEDWGADSIESIEHKDICSDECLHKEFNKYLECEHNTKEINIKKKKFI